MRICPDCSNPVEDNAAFCDNCGLPMPTSSEPAQDATNSEDAGIQAGWSPPSSPSPSAASTPVPGTCSACGHVNVPGETFCMNCGVQLAPVASVPPPPPTPLASEPPSKPPEFKPVRSTSMTCPNCGLVASMNEKFCNNCGAQLNKTTGSLHFPPSQASKPSPPQVVKSTCNNCGSVLIPGEKFCNNCGLQVSSEATVVTPFAGQTLEPATSSEVSHEKPVVASPVNQITGKLMVQATRAKITLPPGKKELLIGRSDPVRNIFPDIDLTIHGGDSSGVSRKHARLSLQNSQIYIEDLNSTNFTFVNRQKLQPGQKHLLGNGDEIRLGLLALEYFAD